MSREPLNVATRISLVAGVLAAVTASQVAPGAAASAGASAAPARASMAAAPSAATIYEDRLLARVNGARAHRGIRPLGRSSCAQRAADNWALWMVSKNRLVHQPLRPLLAHCGASRAGENIAYGNKTADQLFAMWMASPGHRANILSASYTRMGNGIIRRADGRVYGSQVFLRQ